MTALLVSWFGSAVLGWSVTGVIGLLVGWLLNKIPGEKFKKTIGGFGFGLGVLITGGLSKWKWSAPLWNKTIEPVVIDLIDSLACEFIKKLIEGLRSDNKKRTIKAD